MTEALNRQSKILVIKLSALGDFVQTLGPMKAIRDHHPEDHITLLTTKSYVDLAKQSGYFNDIIIDKRPKLFQLHTWFNLAQKLNAKKFNRVYDLQCNDRTNIYFKLFLKKPEWVGIAKGASHQNTNPDRKSDLAFYGHKQTLALAGITDIKIDQMKWVDSNISKFNLKNPYALIVPGCAPTRPEKRWSTAHYGELCNSLVTQGIQPVLLGTSNEKNVTDAISKLCPSALNLTGQTTLFDIVPLARQATFAVGNDTGPMHFIGPTGCKTLVLFSGLSDPKRHRPLGKNVHTIQNDNINNISVEQTLEQINLL